MIKEDVSEEMTLKQRPQGSPNEIRIKMGEDSTGQATNITNLRPDRASPC